jgi:hypothetical protein
MSRRALTDYLTTLIWGGVSGVLGAAPAAPSSLRLIHRTDDERDQGGRRG